jgi:protease-4
MRRTRWLSSPAATFALATFASCALLLGTAGCGSELEVEPGSTLVVRLAGDYVEAAEPSLLGRVLGGGGRPFLSAVSQLSKASIDERIGTVVLHIEGMGVGWGKAEELRSRIARLRETGHKTIAYLEVGQLNSQREYWIASAADEVYLVPAGTLTLVGLAAEYVYLGGVWENLGVEFEVAKAGRYKSAVEAIAGKGMGDASREMAEAILDSADSQFVEGIAAGRGVDVAQVREWIDDAPVLGADLIARGVIDGVEHLEDILAKQDAPVVKGADYASVDPGSLDFDPVASYALIYGSGSVVSGDRSTNTQGDPVFAAGAIADAIEQASEDDEIDGIILRIDSPGGSALASELMWRAIEKARDETGKPIVASFSDVAASGGYYVASAADVIVAPAMTLTGSIGVFSLSPITGGFYDKIGLHTELIARGKHASFLSQTRRHDAETAAKMQSVVFEIYDLFLARVAQGREMSVEQVDAIAQGRVWTGAQALEIGLIDRVGGFREAVGEMNKLSGLDEDADAYLVTYPLPKALGEQISDLLDVRMARAASSAVPIPETFAPLAALERWVAELPPHTPLLVPPVRIEIR